MRVERFDANVATSRVGGLPSFRLKCTQLVVFTVIGFISGRHCASKNDDLRKGEVNNDSLYRRGVAIGRVLTACSAVEELLGAVIKFISR